MDGSPAIRERRVTNILQPVDRRESSGLRTDRRYPWSIDQVSSEAPDTDGIAHGDAFIR